ncbi:UNVERIFIED_CONTAM: hypothetical protein K2H54_057339 [Gekko kuhli]
MIESRLTSKPPVKIIKSLVGGNNLSHETWMISTNKERHSRLGEDNLDDTLEYDFSGLPLKEKKLEELQRLDSNPLVDQDTTHIVETEIKESVPLAPIPPAPSCVLVSICPSSPCSSNMDVPGILEMKDSVAGLGVEISFCVT